MFQYYSYQQSLTKYVETKPSHIWVYVFAVLSRLMFTTSSRISLHFRAHDWSTTSDMNETKYPTLNWGVSGAIRDLNVLFQNCLHNFVHDCSFASYFDLIALSKQVFCKCKSKEQWFVKIDSYTFFKSWPSESNISINQTPNIAASNIFYSFGHHILRLLMIL